MSCGCFGISNWFKGNKNKNTSGQTNTEISTDNVNLFSYNSLRSATRSFHPSNRIGGGGFGVVYKGVLRDGTPVAIKCLSAESEQGTQEFVTEIRMISTIKHPNLVELVGCCVEENNRILVYEYMENNSISTALLGKYQVIEISYLLCAYQLAWWRHLRERRRGIDMIQEILLVYCAKPSFRSSKGKHVAMDWPTRAAICLGTASGLAFLHEEAEPHIVHRDIKASNVLLDGNLQPKIGDFGLAKLFPDNVTHLSTRVAGTMGYLAPEYALLGQLTKKADVYSFGVLILEIISGRSSSKAAFGEDLLALVEWTWKLWKGERLLDIVDPRLTEYPETEAIRFMKVALFCTQAAANQRPNMQQVVKMLSKDVNLNEKALTVPGIYKSQTSKHFGGGGSSDETSSSQKNKGKQSLNAPANSAVLGSADSMTQMLPR